MPRFGYNLGGEERHTAVARRGGKASFVDILGWNQPHPDDYGDANDLDADDCDLIPLAPYLLLDTFPLKDVRRHRPSLAPWEVFTTGVWEEGRQESRQALRHDLATWRTEVAATVLVARASVECSQGLREEAARLREEARRLREEALTLRHACANVREESL